MLLLLSVLLNSPATQYSSSPIFTSLLSLYSSHAPNVSPDATVGIELTMGGSTMVPSVLPALGKRHLLGSRPLQTIAELQLQPFKNANSYLLTIQSGSSNALSKWIFSPVCALPQLMLMRHPNPLRSRLRLLHSSLLHVFFLSVSRKHFHAPAFTMECFLSCLLHTKASISNEEGWQVETHQNTLLLIRWVYAEPTAMGRMTTGGKDTVEVSTLYCLSAFNASKL